LLNEDNYRRLPTDVEVASPTLVQRHVSLLPPRERQRVVGGEVASHGVEVGQVAVLRLHAESSDHVIKVPYSPGRIGALHTMDHLFLRLLRIAVAKFRESRQSEVRRMFLPRTHSGEQCYGEDDHGVRGLSGSSARPSPPPPRLRPARRGLRVGGG
jgi:hypothetical protein